MILLVCIPLYLNTGHGQAFGKRLINRDFSGKIDWRRMHLSVFSGNVEIQKLRLEGPDGDDLAGLDELNLSWSWPNLFRGQLGTAFFYRHRLARRHSGAWYRVGCARNGGYRIAVYHAHQPHRHSLWIQAEPTIR
ncbi:MAG: hypothetical protein U9Q05_04025 [Thermodesulfobacteriota bacterium]|nr:hypothetical protein [Thermodesulfobacteriota bacterium]